MISASTRVEAVTYRDRRQTAETSAAPRQFAYFTSRVRRAQPPRSQYSGWLDDDNDDEGPRRASAPDDSIFGGESKPMVSGSRAVSNRLEASTR
ncbi:MAG: hypothetical protein ACXWG7_04475 [Chthoniobacterales bacterium]